jgi:hypothetical protein
VLSVIVSARWPSYRPLRPAPRLVRRAECDGAELARTERPRASDNRSIPGV